MRISCVFKPQISTLILILFRRGNYFIFSCDLWDAQRIKHAKT